MKSSSVLGFFILLITVYFGAIMVLPDQEAVVNPSSILLVVGGTVSAFLIAFPLKGLNRVFGLFIKRGFNKPLVSQKMYIVRDLMQVLMLVDKDDQRIMNGNFAHPFLKEGAYLLLDKELNYDDLEYILYQRAENFHINNKKDHKILESLAKFPPAFGLLGSVTGIIAMLMSLGTAGKEAIGEGMAVALLTTFWGIAIANMIILPLADFTDRMNEEDKETRDLIVDGLLLIKGRPDIGVFSKKIRSFMTMKERAVYRSIESDILKESNLYDIESHIAKNQEMVKLGND